MKQKLLILSLSLFIAMGLNAQTHFPIRTPQNMNITNCDSDAFEKLVMKWNAGLNAVQQQVNATNWDYQAFTSNYQSSIDSERYLFYQGAHAGTINASNINAYINIKQQKLRALYNSYITNRNNYNSHQPRNGHPLFPNADTPPSCNASCTNMDFGTGDLSGWYGYYAQNSSNFNYNITGMTGGYLGATQRGAYDPTTRTYQVHITQATERDWFLNSRSIIMSQASPWGNGYSVMLGDSIVPDAQVATLIQEFKVTAADNSMTYAYSALLENPSHSYYDQPFFSVTLFDSAGDTIKNCGEYFVSSGPGLPGFIGVWDPSDGDTVYWRNWTQVNIPLGSYIGQCVTIQFQVGDCSLGGHFGYAYVDASCENLVVTASSPTGALCNGGTIDLYGPAGESGYHWYGPTNSILTNDTLQNVTVDSLGTYTLVVTPSTGELCKDTLFFQVKYIDTLKAKTSLVTPINCAAGTGSASASANYGIPPYSYSWSNHQTSATATGLTAGGYTVTVTDSNGCSASADITLTEPPAIVAIATFTTATCGYSNGTGHISASGGVPGYSYLWTPTNNTNATVTGLSAGNYTVTVTDANGCTATASINMATNFVAATMGPITDVSCFGGSNGTATANVTGGITPYTYSWSPRGGNGVTGTGLTAGDYTVTVRDNSGCSSTALAVITQPSVVTARATVVSDPLCNGNATGSASVTGGGGTPTYTYRWTPSNQTNVTATGLSAGTYTVTVTDSHGCTGTTTATITQPAVLAVTAALSNICNPGSAKATASPTGGTSPYQYLWTPSNQTTATATGVSAGIYTVKVTDKNGCTASANVSEPTQVTATITASTNILCYSGTNGSATSVAAGGIGPYTYLWSPTNKSTATANNLGAGRYTVTITDHDGCTATATTTLTQPADLTVSISGPNIRCLGNSGVFTANVSGGTGPYIYSWAPGTGVSNTAVPNPTITPVGTQTYTVTVTDAHGCIAYGYENFSFPPPLAVGISGASVTCSGRYANLCAQPTGGTGGDIFLWEPVNLASSCITIPVDNSTIYTVTVTDNCNVSVKASTTVHVVPPPAVVFKASAVQGCTPFCVQFQNLTPAIGGKEQYIWNFGNGDSLLTENPVYCYNQNGVYDVTLTVITDSGCASTLTKTGLITVNSSPKTAFTYSPQPVSILTPTVQFTDLSSDNYGIAYRWWNFGDGSDSASSSAVATHTYQDTGNYCVTLITMNDKGCSDTATNCLVVEPLYNLYIPSAFTPNGDGLNETFQPKGEYIKSFEMYIFDRWGSEIYHTTDITQGWNGAVHNTGATCQEDTYIYKIIVTDAQGNPHSYIGNVTLLK